jgi:hypothetical protein
MTPIKQYYFQGHYLSWWKSRMNTLKSILTPGFFSEKSILDMGSGFGTFANMLVTEMRADPSRITCSEGRVEYVNEIRRRFPAFNVRVDDYDSPTFGIDEKYDVICCFGVLQHVVGVERLVASLRNKCTYLLLDVEVLDSTEVHMQRDNVENGYDVSMHGRSSRITAECVENLLMQQAFMFSRITDKSLNTACHRYNWNVQHTGNKVAGHHRFWVCVNQADGGSFDKCLRVNNDDRHMVPEEVMQYCNDNVVTPSLLDAAMHAKQDRVSVFADADHEKTVLQTLGRYGYKIYGVYAVDDGKRINVMAVLPHVHASEQFSFVIQGIAKGYVTDVTRNICFNYGIPVDATWGEHELHGVLQEMQDKKYSNNQNVYLHTMSTLKGIDQCTTRFVVKVRADEFYRNMYPIISHLQANPDKIVTNNVFARKISKYAFHVSDHVIGGSKENMYLMFSVSKENLQSRKQDGKCAEQHLVQGYLRARGSAPLPTDYNQVKALMQTYFHVVSIRQMGNYRVIANSVNKIVLTLENSSQYYAKFVDVESIDEM